MPEIAFVTTCKGRLHHLQETLPTLLAESPDEIVVVDYGCPQKAGDWVEANHPGVTVVRVDDDPGFCLPRARNLGARASGAEWIVFVDADVRVRPGFIDWLRRNAHQRLFHRAGSVDGAFDPETWGTVACPRKAFDALGGYDEVFRGWGGEDDDLYRRLWLAGMGEGRYPGAFVDPIRHGDDERVAFHALKDRRVQGLINQCYVETKAHLMTLRGRRARMPLDVRQRMMDRIRTAFAGWDPDSAEPPPSLTWEFRGSVGATGGGQIALHSRFTVSPGGSRGGEPVRSRLRASSS